MLGRKGVKGRIAFPVAAWKKTTASKRTVILGMGGSCGDESGVNSKETILVCRLV